MNTLSYKTISANEKTVNKEWVLIDAENEILGRLASKSAMFLRGKYKTNFTPHVDCGDNVIIINAAKIKLTGDKLTDKEYVSHTGYPGGQRFTTPRELLAKKNQLPLWKKPLKACFQKTALDVNFSGTCTFMQAPNTHIRLNNPKSSI